MSNTHQKSRLYSKQFKKTDIFDLFSIMKAIMYKTNYYYFFFLGKKIHLYFSKITIGAQAISVSG